jgi:hypothetical protein
VTEEGREEACASLMKQTAMAMERRRREDDRVTGSLFLE